MATPPVILHGILRADGTLELEKKVELPAGPVQVTVQPVRSPVPPAEDWWQVLQRARATLEAAGTGFRSEEEIERERQDFRSEEP